jgi:hypothetical protein
MALRSGTRRYLHGLPLLGCNFLRKYVRVQSGVDVHCLRSRQPEADLERVKKRCVYTNVTGLE